MNNKIIHVEFRESELEIILSITEDAIESLNSSKAKVPSSLAYNAIEDKIKTIEHLRLKIRKYIEKFNSQRQT